MYILESYMEPLGKFLIFGHRVALSASASTTRHRNMVGDSVISNMMVPYSLSKYIYLKCTKNDVDNDSGLGITQQPQEDPDLGL